MSFIYFLVRYFNQTRAWKFKDLTGLQYNEIRNIRCKPDSKFYIPYSSPMNMSEHIYFVVTRNIYFFGKFKKLKK